ncbi:hypothetical protein HPB52_021289 [Rhipicephalus sanguineus]|uniref:Tick transposon n=1 Tax=Rhipicephalus sanguineus TaxID=34632 RepID=A0A9D4T240_RHISA|nr:hypothetical protein HPB52_021289 [Rhipicephalus sanguineus]
MCLFRDLWKSVHVPGLTLANAILCLSANTREWLERGQRAVGRLALGCHGRVAVEAIQGGMGWSAFEAREAQSKIGYEARLRNMDDTRRARKLFPYTNIVGIRTQWCARAQTLRRKYGFLARTEDEAAERKTAIRTLVRQAENAQWSANAQRKTTMALYCEHKGEISAEPLYDNSVGSTLLFEARAGALRTLSYRRHFDADPDVQMALCRYGAVTRIEEQLKTPGDEASYLKRTADRRDQRDDAGRETKNDPRHHEPSIPDFVDTPCALLRARCGDRYRCCTAWNVPEKLRNLVDNRLERSRPARIVRPGAVKYSFGRGAKTKK